MIGNKKEVYCTMCGVRIDYGVYIGGLIPVDRRVEGSQFRDGWYCESCSVKRKNQNYKENVEK